MHIRKLSWTAQKIFLFRTICTQKLVTVDPIKSEMTLHPDAYNFTTWKSRKFPLLHKHFLLFTQFLRRSWIWQTHSINGWKYTDISNNIFFLLKTSYFQMKRQAVLFSSTEITTFHIFHTLAPVWIPPNFHELFHYKPATVVVCEFLFSLSNRICINAFLRIHKFWF
jgi:hypothetical protein